MDRPILESCTESVQCPHIYPESSKWETLPQWAWLWKSKYVWLKHALTCEYAWEMYKIIKIVYVVETQPFKNILMVAKLWGRCCMPWLPIDITLLKISYSHSWSENDDSWSYRRNWHFLQHIADHFNLQYGTEDGVSKIHAWVTLPTYGNSLFWSSWLLWLQILFIYTKIILLFTHLFNPSFKSQLCLSFFHIRIILNFTDIFFLKLW